MIRPSDCTAHLLVDTMLIMYPLVYVISLPSLFWIVISSTKKSLCIVASNPFQWSDFIGTKLELSDTIDRILTEKLLWKFLLWLRVSFCFESVEEVVSVEAGRFFQHAFQSINRCAVRVHNVENNEGMVHVGVAEIEEAARLKMEQFLDLLGHEVVPETSHNSHPAL